MGLLSHDDKHISSFLGFINSQSCYTLRGKKNLLRAIKCKDTPGSGSLGDISLGGGEVFRSVAAISPLLLGALYYPPLCFGYQVLFPTKCLHSH